MSDKLRRMDGTCACLPMRVSNLQTMQDGHVFNGLVRRSEASLRRRGPARADYVRRGTRDSHWNRLEFQKTVSVWSFWCAVRSRGRWGNPKCWICNSVDYLRFSVFSV